MKRPKKGEDLKFAENGKFSNFYKKIKDLTNKSYCQKWRTNMRFLALDIIKSNITINDNITVF